MRNNTACAFILSCWLLYFGKDLTLLKGSHPPQLISFAEYSAWLTRIGIGLANDCIITVTVTVQQQYTSPTKLLGSVTFLIRATRPS